MKDEYERTAGIAILGIIIIWMLSSILQGCATERSGEYEMAYVQLMSVRRIDGQYEIIWKDRHDVIYPVYRNDTVGMNLKVGVLMTSLIKK